MKLYPLTLKVNGEIYEVDVSSNRTLLEIIRDEIGLKGTKHGCGTGDCGACTVLVDGRAVNSCLLLAVEAEGKEVTTIEGLSEKNKLHKVQQAFVDYGAAQCGFCTSGMILSAKALLDTNSSPGEEEVRSALAGNLCRCTGYQKILEAVLSLAKRP